MWVDNGYIYASNIRDNSKKNIISGNNTKNHENMGDPARQMRFKIHVQKRMYRNFMIKIIYTLDTSHE